MQNNNWFFPKGFHFGCATAAYQIEGAVHEDGRGDCIWDTFTRIPGNIITGENADIACDHYHRYNEDIRLMKEIGLTAYRFSISWSRIFPKGKGQLNQRGLDFYKRLIDELLNAGIQPFATLYHWDLPQALQDSGGWENRDTVYYFRDYAGEIARQLGNNIHHWTTHNEPWVVAFAGHYHGAHAPGIKSLSSALQVAHHLLLSHGEAVIEIRNNTDPTTQIGITLNLIPYSPASTSDLDKMVVKRCDGHLNRWFLDPLFKGEYPQDMVDFYGKETPVIEEDDLKVIQAPIDFLGVNYYMRFVVKHSKDGNFLDSQEVQLSDSNYTDMGWEVYPEGLFGMLKRLRDEYHVPALYITENGAAYPDSFPDNNRIFDSERVNYLQKHFEQAYKSIQVGIPLKGYFIWSLMDNFEWGLGYSKRFGIVYTDYPTQQRIIKESGHWFKNFISLTQSQ